MNNDENEDISRAKQAISPKGLGDQSATGDVGNELPDSDLPNDDLDDSYTDGDDEPGANVREMNPNRNPNDKPDIDKPAYS